MMTASKLQNESLVKYVNIKMWQSFLVHIIFKVSSINIWIHIYSVLLSVVIEWVNMLTVTIVTAGITGELRLQYKSKMQLLVKNENKMLQWQNIALN